MTFYRSCVALLLVLLSCVSHGFTIPKPHHQATASSIRGGGENEDLDAYIEALIAGVSDPEDDDQVMRGGGEAEPVLENDEEEEADDDAEEEEVAVVDATEESAEKKQDPVAVTQTVVEEQVDHAGDDEAPMVRPKTRRPNALYRFLLNQGRIGHYVVLFLVWLVEFVTTYIPPLANALSAVWIAIFGVAPVVMEEQHTTAAPGVRGKANKNQAGFADNRAGRGKQRTKASQKEDKDAAAQLRRLGNVNEARYKLLSMDFMKKHRLGPYATTSSLSTIVEEEEAVVEEVDEDEDVDWVVEALTTEEHTVKPPSSKKRKKKKVNVSSSVGVSTKGVSVGVEFSIGGSSSSSSKRRRKRKTSKLIEAATSSRETKVAAGPRVSDKEGGMLGRLRDFSTNNLVSRSLMGAYPGDALPPSQAASSTGVLELARKYGYGDWSDDEDEEGMGRKRRRKRRKVTSSGGSSRKSSSSSSRSPSSKRRKSRKSSSSNLSVEFSTSASRRRPSVSPSLKKLSDPASKRVRLPLERLKEKDESLNGD